MTQVQGHLGSISFDGRTVAVTKKARGETRVPLAQVQAVEIGRAGIGMRYMRIVAAGASNIVTSTALGSHKDAAQDPTAVTFRSKHEPDFVALRDEIEAAIAEQG